MCYLTGFRFISAGYLSGFECMLRVAVMSDNIVCNWAAFVTEVVASNKISSVKSSLDIHVLLPVPRNLTVAVVTEADELPWCHLDRSSRYHVYSGMPVDFEADVPISANVTFEWKVVDNATGETVEEVSVEGIPCFHGQSCTSSVQV